MKFEELGLETGKTLLLLPGTACTWQINFAMVIDDLKERYHLICVNYDGFDGDNNQPFTDMITVTEKIEAYILQYHNGRVDGAYGSSLGGSFVGLLVQRKRIHIDHAILGGSDLDQGGKIPAKLAAGIVSHFMKGATKSPKKKEKLMNLLQKALGIEMTDETAVFLDQFADSVASLHPKTVSREFYSDYITPLENDIHVDGTTVHIIYARKMGEKYEQRYLEHFRDPDIIPFDMPHEAWLFSKTWKQPVLEAINNLMISDQKGVSTL
jgi:hypothetical protein